MKNRFDMLENNINEEVTLYKELENLYKEKQEILINKKSEVLADVDSRILKVLESIKSLVEKRQEITASISGKVMTLSEVVDESRKIDLRQSKRFDDKKDEINTLVKTLIELDAINTELTKHGIKVTNKIMQMILNNINIPTNAYDQKGKMVDKGEINISSIVEEV